MPTDDTNSFSKDYAKLIGMNVKIHIYDSIGISTECLLNNKCFSYGEKHTFDKYKHIETKNEKIVSEIFKRKYIGDYHLNEFGKPISDNCYFNISHSYGVVVFVMDTVPVGIDIEKIRDAEDDLVNYISNEKEKAYIRDGESFYEVWTNKEALVKAYGTGIKRKPNEIIGLPINGIRYFEGKTFYNKTIKYDDYVITVSREDDKDFELEIIKEVI